MLREHCFLRLDLPIVYLAALAATWTASQTVEKGGA
jgi:hypothetical protein